MNATNRNRLPRLPVHATRTRAAAIGAFPRAGKCDKLNDAASTAADFRIPTNPEPQDAKGPPLRGGPGNRSGQEPGMRWRDNRTFPQLGPASQPPFGGMRSAVPVPPSPGLGASRGQLSYA